MHLQNSSEGKEEIGHGGTSYQQPFLGLYTKSKAMCALIRVISNIATAHSWAKHQLYITQLIMLVDIKCLWQPRTQKVCTSSHIKTANAQHTWTTGIPPQHSRISICLEWTKPSHLPTSLVIEIKFVLSCSTFSWKSTYSD